MRSNDADCPGRQGLPQRRLPCRRLLRCCLLTVVSLAGFAQAQGMPAPERGPLVPTQIERIQRVGRAVLVAKRNQPVDPALAEARSQLNELRAAVDELVEVQALEVRAGRALVGTDGPRDGPEPRADRASRAHERFKGVRARQRTELDARAPSASAAQSHVAEATARLRDWIDEAEAAITAPAPERASRLRALATQLRGDQQPVPSAFDRQPTLSTLVRHRE